MRLRERTSNIIIVVVSLFLGVLICEAGSRLLLRPSDYLSPKMIRDTILGHRIESYSSGFDEWGFRNRGVPPTAEVVTVGDSHTYGNTAAMDDSWPSVVSRITGFEVYNLGLGGYGPNQYYYLLATKGLKLHPKWVVCGLYMGDDFENAFSITHGFDYWSSLRHGHFDNVNPDIWDPGPPVWGASVRNWLSAHSILYKIIVHGPFMGMLKEYVRFKQVSANSDPYTTAVIVNGKNIREAFRPIGVAESLNQSSALIQEGMRITFHLLQEMDKACREQGCKLIVVIIPTKETVFSDYIENNPELHLYEQLNQVIVNERYARKALVQFLTNAEIMYLDALPALKQANANHLYAETTRDMHPGKNGYKVIGEVVADHLKHLATSAEVRPPARF